MNRLDVNAFVGEYPWRHLPGTSVDALLAAMDRTAIDRAWVSHLPSLFWRDPAPGNAWLAEAVRPHDRLTPVFSVQPAFPGWRDVLQMVRDAGGSAVRCDPQFRGLASAGAEMRELAAACGADGLWLLMAVRLEDLRQRHPNDTSGDLPAWAIRDLIRSDERLRLLVTHADRDTIEQVHFGSTPDEAARITWDICWLWGPPEDHLELLMETVGRDRFVFGTGQPLRIPESAVAKLELSSGPA